MARRVLKSKRRRVSPLRRFALALYGIIVALSAVIVVGYAAFRMMAKPPELAQPTAPAVSAAPGASAVPEEPQLQRKEYTYTFLLLANDQSSGNTDTMMVATYDTVQQQVGLVSIPRDTMINGVRDSDGYHFYKLNSMYAMNGIDALKEEITKILGIPIDFYVKVDTKGFVDLVDAVGGIYFDVPIRMSYDDPTQDLHIHFDPGMQYLNGTDALKVARCRKNSDGPGSYPNNVYDAYSNSDIGRTETQRNLLITVLQAALSQPLKLPTYYDIFLENVKTDLTLSDLAFFAESALSLDFSTGLSTAVLPGDGSVTYHGWEWCYELYPDQVLEIVNTQGLNPYTTDITADMLDIAQT